MLLRSRSRLVDLVDVDVREPDVARLALLHELAERLDGLGERRHAVRLVQHVDVDHVRAQPLERAFDGPADIGARRAWHVLRAAGNRMPELRQHDEAVAPALEDLAQELLALGRAVDVGRVEERDPLVECGVDDRAALVEPDPPTEVVGPEPDHGDLGAARSETSRQHDLTYTWRFAPIDRLVTAVL